MTQNQFTQYQQGLTKFLARLSQNHPRHSEATTYQQRLLENLAQATQHGDTEQYRHERSQILTALDDLCRQTLRIPFHQLCDLDSFEELTARAEISSITGPTHTGSGDIIVNNFGLAYQALKSALPNDAPAIQSLVESLKGFSAYHELINEWKELHNLLQDLYTTIQLFYVNVARLDDLADPFNKRNLRQNWRTCQLKMQALKEFSKGIKHIEPEPYRESEGESCGPEWITKLVKQEQNLEDMLSERNCDIGSLDDQTSKFSNTCYGYLYRADKDLRKEVGNLYALSIRILGKFTE